MEWDSRMDEALRLLWEHRDVDNKPIFTREIGQRMGMTKNAIVGRAHRLNLPARASPIRRHGGVRDEKRIIARAGPVTLPPLGSLEQFPVGPVIAVMQREPKRPLDQSRPQVMFPRGRAPKYQRPTMPILARTFGRVSECMWPEGEVGTRNFRFCDDPTLPGRPYCQCHCDRAYMKIERTPRVDPVALYNKRMRSNIRGVESAWGARLEW